MTARLDCTNYKAGTITLIGFINAEAEGGKVGDLLSHNVFAYCGNNPIIREDPDGHMFWFVAMAIAAVVATVVSFRL